MPLTHEYVSRMLTMTSRTLSRLDRVYSHITSMRASVETLAPHLQEGATYVLDALLSDVNLLEFESDKDALDAYQMMEGYTSRAAARMRRYRLRRKAGLISPRMSTRGRS